MERTYSVGESLALLAVAIVLVVLVCAGVVGFVRMIAGWF